MRHLTIRNDWERVAFFGPMASGKSWSADYLVKYGQYKKFAFAGKLKGIAYELFDVTSKDGKARSVLQDLGDYMRRIDPEVWINYTLRQIASAEITLRRPRIVLDDLRYVNEAEVLRENGFKIIEVSTPPDIREDRIKNLYPNFDISSHNHVSEKEWELIKPDFRIRGYGLEAVEDLEKLLDVPLSASKS